MSDYFDDYAELELNKEESRLLDTDLQIERPLRRGALERGSKEYALDYKNRLTKLWMDSPTNIKPYDWQLDAALASHLGLDVLVIAGTGFGKTWSFVLNCLDNPKLLVYIISPLNALANQQAKIFNDASIKAVAVNSTTNHPGLYKEILQGKYQVVISSIEAFLDTTRLLPAVKSTELAKTRTQTVVLDEAHYSRQFGHTLLHFLRQHLDPEVRHQVELYHSMRGEWDKAVIAYGFEKENGYKVLFSTEAMTMGLDFRKVTRVIQFLACSDMETGIQRGGRGGRDSEVECDVVFMVQDSLFDDSKEGQKRAAKEEQQSPTELAANKKATFVKGKGKSSAKTYSDSIRQFINAPGCLVEVIDREFDNPPREAEKCLCQYHKQLRGEPSLREQMRAM
ncbi:DEAD/DEAH-box helicase [Rhizoctonia solani 123E]|uniref:DNA 3'-5' helicase n=1 Tax=Rhizoctonia solani 123E TaxID=1423351 RepID=A0A074RLW8_9AGAM|nr:DEAD/DEAH-box helicase [Rhizoctonia solani 123E]